MNILVVNLTRFGDLLQSAAAVRALAEKDGGTNGLGTRHRVGVVCIENFAAGAALLPDVEAVFPLPSGRILAALNAPPPDPARPKSQWLGGIRELYMWLNGVREVFAPDAVYNLSPTSPSCLLARLLAGEAEYYGFTIDSFGYRRNTTPWASFMQGAAASRAASPFNIVDIFRKISDSADRASDASLAPVPQQIAAETATALAARTPADARGYAALQLGASAAVRQWPVTSFAAVGDALWEKHKLLPLLLGSKSEKALGEEYAAVAKNEHLSLIGETDITGLGAALSLSSLLISNDTGTLHLASGIGIPVIGIYLATAQPWDTGPYAEGSYSLEADLPCHPCGFAPSGISGAPCGPDPACHKKITPETVTALAEKILIPGEENFSPTTGARIWKTTRDAHGLADLLSLSGHETAERTQWMRVQRLVFRQFFDNAPNAPFIFDPVKTLPRVSGETRAILASGCDAALALFDALLQQAAMLTENPVPIIKDRFQRSLGRLSDVLSSIPPLAAIAFMWREDILAQQSLEDCIPIMARYRELFRAVRSLV